MTAATPLVPAVVVVHGALGSARQMAPVVEALRALRQFADVVPVELPGHGETALATGQPFDMIVLADALGEAIARAGVRWCSAIPWVATSRWCVNCARRGRLAAW
jgi:pimeloyl-ACP methyl ester carboxylesterase